MIVLYLTHSCPYPPHKGDRIRSFNILKHLSLNYDVKLVYPSFSSNDYCHISKLEKYCTSVQTIKIRPILAKIRCLCGFFTNDPLTKQYFYSKEISDIIRNTEFDLVLIDCSSMASYVADVKKPRIIDYIDVDYDKWRMYSEISHIPKSLIYHREYIKLKEFEESINLQFDHSIVISENEKNLLPKRSNVTVMPNGIDFQNFSPAEEYVKNSIVFFGAMNYFPNVDAVLYFHEQILPLIRSKVPDVQFTIAGMCPVKKVRKLASKDVIVTGYVPDIRSYVAHAAVCVVPLRIAKGIQNKVLEAMAMEVPVVATTAANRGIGARDKKEILLPDSPADFARATLALLMNVGLRKEIATNAKQFVLKNFSWETHLRKLDDVITRVMASSPR